MPVYSFKCPKCALVFEKALKVNFEGATPCPSCSENCQKLPPQNVMGKMAEPTSIPKEIDLKIGKDADERWEDYEEKRQVKEKIRKESNTPWLSKDLDGDYVPLSVTKDGKEVTGAEGAALRDEMVNEFKGVSKDPDTEKVAE